MLTLLELCEVLKVTPKTLCKMIQGANGPLFDTSKLWGTW